MASPVVGAEGSRVERARKSGCRPVSGAPKAWTACSGRGEGFSCRCRRRRLRGECRAGAAPAVGLRSPGVGLRSSGVGEAETVAVDVGVGVAVGGCATETAAPTTVSSAAAAQMIWPRRRKLATMRRRSATMERDYRPGADGGGLPPCKWWCGAAVRPTEPATEGGPRSPRGGAQHLDFAHSRRADVISRVRSGRRLAARSQPGPGPPICPNAGAADLGALDLMRDFWGLASRHSIGGDHDATTAHVSRAWRDPGLDVVSVRRGAERAGGRLAHQLASGSPVGRFTDYVSDLLFS